MYKRTQKNTKKFKINCIALLVNCVMCIIPESMMFCNNPNIIPHQIQGGQQKTQLEKKPKKSVPKKLWAL